MFATKTVRTLAIAGLVLMVPIPSTSHAATSKGPDDPCYFMTDWIWWAQGIEFDVVHAHNDDEPTDYSMGNRLLNATGTHHESYDYGHMNADGHSDAGKCMGGGS